MDENNHSFHEPINISHGVYGFSEFTPASSANENVKNNLNFNEVTSIQNNRLNTEETSKCVFMASLKSLEEI